MISSQTVYVKYSILYCSEINIRQPYYRNETILYKAMWSDDDHLYVMWMNRLQNKSHLVHYHIENNAADVKEVSLNYTLGIYLVLKFIEMHLRLSIFATRPEPSN